MDNVGVEKKEVQSEEIQYEGSALWKNVEYTKDSEQLRLLGLHIQSAVRHWEEEGDERNRKFFEQAKNHWCHVTSGRPDNKTLEAIDKHLKDQPGTQLSLI